MNVLRSTHLTIARVTCFFLAIALLTGCPCLMSALYYIALDAEEAQGDGDVRLRSNAHEGKTVLLFPGESIYFTELNMRNGKFEVWVTYSNDNADDVLGEIVDVYLDDELFGSFAAKDTGSHGLGWDNFAESPILGIFTPDGEKHVFSLTVREDTGDSYGIEIDYLGMREYCER